MSNPVGKPLRWKKGKDLQKEIDAYFLDCDTRKKPYTITGMASFLGVNRLTLLQYEKMLNGSSISDKAKEDLSDVICSAKAKIEAYYEEQGFLNPRASRIILFTLQNNFGWKDKKEVDVTGTDDKLKNLNEAELQAILDKLV